MRYFKYKNTDKNIKNAFKEQYKILTDDERHRLRQEKRWRKFSTIVALIIYCFFVVVGISMIKSIPTPSFWLWECLVIIGEVIIGFVLLIAFAFLTAILTKPLWKKVESFHIPSMKKEIFSKACKHLRDYYQLQDPYLITKCFDSTDKKFTNHDVCIFVVGDELRITADLMHGFLYGERDLGCYAFKKEEITLSKRKDGNQLILEFKTDDIIFLLGYRARGFINKIFLQND